MVGADVNSRKSTGMQKKEISAAFSRGGYGASALIFGMKLSSLPQNRRQLNYCANQTKQCGLLNGQSRRTSYSSFSIIGMARKARFGNTPPTNSSCSFDSFVSGRILIRVCSSSAKTAA